MAQTAFVRSVTTARQWASASHGYACMPHDTARDAELELQLVMTSALLVDGLPVATVCFLVIYKFGCQI